MTQDSYSVHQVSWLFHRQLLSELKRLGSCLNLPEIVAEKLTPEIQVD